jgi:hypothetical protein
MAFERSERWRNRFTAFIQPGAAPRFHCTPLTKAAMKSPVDINHIPLRLGRFEVKTRGLPLESPYGKIWPVQLLMKQFPVSAYVGQPRSDAITPE